jgi:hypothetical protein
VSDFAGDDEMAELLRQFLDGLDETCRQRARGLEAGDVATVRRVGHQLRGLAAATRTPS